ncbi:MAG TPA: class I SAM-dependent methyltransferase [Chitinophagaceae bacterium]|nr:class I SAM-dependent methyltransferase [Chitinophagaceae bacterium]
MTLVQHTDSQVRFDQQVENSAAYVIPFIEETFPLTATMRVMEIGCGEGGVLKPLLDRGLSCVGVDLVPERIALAGQYLSEFVSRGKLRLIARDIYDLDFLGEFRGYFDLIILKDAIEHIPDQARIIGYLKELLKPGAQVFFGFPPWYMPHGGHQQICQSRVLSMWPYVHLLPKSVYRALIRAFREDPSTLQELMEVRSTGISIERFERILKQQGYIISGKRHYLINPIYQVKFHLKPRRQLKLISGIPYIRDLLTTCVYYLVKPGPD